MPDRTDQRFFPRAKYVYGISLPDDWPGDRDFLDVQRAGSKKGGYHYALVTFSGEGTFRFLWLTDDERRELVKALGGHINE